MDAFPEVTYNGTLPEGCKMCAKGAKLVLFINGICLGNCYYCPLSKERKGKWDTWANERRVGSDEDILDEARKMDATGTGITGGDPLMFADATIKYATLLKDTFSESHHIHLYTPGILADRNILRYLEGVVDEIRFHPTRENWEKIRLALNYDMTVGAEIPVIPGTKEDIMEFASYLDEIGASFLNLNELEYSETNRNALKSRGFELSSESNAVFGSEKLALEIVEATKDLDISVHYCSSRFKDAVQLRERLKRRAKNIRKKYEDIDEDGLIVHGTIEAPSLKTMGLLLESISDLIEEDNEMIEVKGTKLFTSWAAAEELKTMLDIPGLEFFIEKEYPTHTKVLIEKERI